MTPRQMSIMIEEQGVVLSAAKQEIANLWDALATANAQLQDMTASRDGAQARARLYASELSVMNQSIRALNADRERFEWFFADDRVSTDALIDLQLRHINREKTTVDEWRNAIDQARNA